MVGQFIPLTITDYIIDTVGDVHDVPIIKAVEDELGLSIINSSTHRRMSAASAAEGGART